DRAPGVRVVGIVETAESIDDREVVRRRSAAAGGNATRPQSGRAGQKEKVPAGCSHPAKIPARIVKPQSSASRYTRSPSRDQAESNVHVISHLEGSPRRAERREAQVRLLQGKLTGDHDLVRPDIVMYRHCDRA